MKIYKIVFACALISLHGILNAHVDSVIVNDMVLHVRDINEHLHDLSKDAICAVQELLNKEDLATVDVDLLDPEVKALLYAFFKEYDSKIIEAAKNEDLLKKVGFSGFFGVALLAAFFGYDALPHVTNKFINEQLHSSKNHNYVLIALSVAIFYTLYKAQAYQNERITLENMESIHELKKKLCGEQI